MSLLSAMCEAFGVKAEVKYGVSERIRSKYDVGTTDKDWRATANPWTVTLRYKGRRMTVPFYTGSAWTKEPGPADVLSCLLSDATSVENARGFEDWCADFGYDTDSRKALAVFEECKRNAAKVRRLLGDEFETLAHAEH